MQKFESLQLQEYLLNQPEVISYLGSNTPLIKEIIVIQQEANSSRIRLDFDNTPRNLILKIGDVCINSDNPIELQTYLDLHNYLYEHGVPLQKIIHVCNDNSVIGTPFIVLEEVVGINLDFQYFLKLSHFERQDILEQVLMIIDKIQSVPIHQALPHNNGTLQIQKLIHLYKQHETKINTIIESLCLWFTINNQEQQNDVVCHGSLTFSNFIINPETFKIQAIEGFENAHVGNKQTDLANFFSFLFIQSDLEHIQGLKGLHKYIGCDETTLTKFNVKPELLKIQVAQMLFKNAIAAQVNKQYPIAEEFSKQAWLIINDVTSGDPFNIAEQVQKDKSLWSGWEVSDRAKYLYYKVKEFMNTQLFPIERDILKEMHTRQGPERYHDLKRLTELQQKVKEQGLWNLFLSDPKYGRGLTNVEYTFISELMGHSHFGHELFNCFAPDTGNIKLMVVFGNEHIKKKYLEPLYNGDCKSYFAMTEREVSSSDPTNFQTTITPVEGGYIVNGKKWYVCSIAHQNCKFGIVMGKAPGDDPKAKLRQSLIIIDHPNPQVKVLKTAHIIGYDYPPFGLMEVVYDNVFVPKENLLGKYGEALKIVQSRLTGGRVQHTVRMIGMTQRCLHLVKERADTRTLFRQKMLDMESFQTGIAQCEIKLQTCRLLCLSAAMLLDKVGSRDFETLKAVSQCKSYGMRTCYWIIDEAIQKFGAEGGSNEEPLALALQNCRANRFMDGPDELHLRQVAKITIGQHLFSEYRSVEGYGIAKL